MVEETSVSSPRKPRKVLFLDIDGVLNRSGTKERCLGFTGVDRKLSDMLVQWLHKNDDVEVVLSSTWRKYPEMHSHINEAGISWTETTPFHSQGTLPRVDEIKAWLAANPEVKLFAALDDVYCAELGEHWVGTDERYGLQPAHLLLLNEIFNEDLG